MTTTIVDLRTAILDAIGSVAPDIDTATLGPDEDLFDELGLDSMDLLNIVTAVHGRTGLEVPERDYPACTTVRGFTAELARLAGLPDPG